MEITRIIPQLRTTNLAATIDFYTATLGFAVEFRYEDFYAAVKTGTSVIHFKQVDAPDPSIAFVADGDHLHLYLETADVCVVAEELKRKGVPLVQDVHDTEWGTRECVIRDNEGHTLYFAERRTIRPT